MVQLDSIPLSTGTASMLNTARDVTRIFFNST